MPASLSNPSDFTVHLLWLTASASCSGDASPANATLRDVENTVSRSIAGLPRVVPHWACGDDRRGGGFIQWLWKAAAGDLDPFVLVVEGSIPNDDFKSASDSPAVKTDGFVTRRLFDQHVKTTEWLDRLAPMATAIVAAGTCATYGGVTTVTENRGGVMGVPDYLGWNWKSKAGLHVVCVPGCPVQPDNLTETLLYLLHHVSGKAPVIQLDENLRPAWVFGGTIDQECGRQSDDQRGAFTDRSATCLAKIGRGVRTFAGSARRAVTNPANWRHAS